MPLEPDEIRSFVSSGIGTHDETLTRLWREETQHVLTLSDLMWEPDTNWRSDAACTGVDSEIFFPVLEDDPRAAAKAKSICGECPVREACLQYALATNQAAGVWGGLDAAERRRLRRRIRDRERRKAS